MDDVIRMKGLSDQERLMFQNEMTANRKDVSTGVVLCLFLGAFGAHRFYMKQSGLGAVYAVLSWTGVTLLVALVECFLMPARVREFNDALATEAVTKIKALRAND